jgi:hypothetical protein
VPKRDWAQFEDAVALFLSALEPSAKVSKNARIPDVDTGHPRQRDVWIESDFGGHLKVTFLVSCKRHKRKMDSQDLDAFMGELRSSGANKGILYSYSGFTKPAIEKGRELGVACCNLYIDRPPEIPEVLLFESYCCSSAVRIHVVHADGIAEPGGTYEDLFAVDVPGQDGIRSLLDGLVLCYQQGETRAVDAFKAEARELIFPEDWAYNYTLTDADTGVELCRILVAGHWKIYRGLLNATLVNGSYEYTSGKFRGTEMAPYVNFKNPDPGPGWELLHERPSAIGRDRIILLRYGGDVRTALLEHYSGQRLEQPNSSDNVQT